MAKTSVKFDVDSIFRESGIIAINSEVTKSMEFEENLKNGASNVHEKADGVRIHQSATLDKYKSVARDFFHFERQNGSGRDYFKYNENDVKEYLSSKVEENVPRNTFNSICTALEKLDNILNACDGGSRDWHNAINEVRHIVQTDNLCERTDTNHRAYQDPQKVIDCMARPGTQLAAELELRTGLRSGDVTGQIKINPDGTLDIKSKAGYHVPNFKIPSDLLDRLKTFEVSEGRAFLCTYSQYSYDLKNACSSANEEFSGTHSMRHCFAQNLYNDLRSQGVPEIEAKGRVSEALFHSRLSIVEVYLR